MSRITQNNNEGVEFIQIIPSHKPQSKSRLFRWIWWTGTVLIIGLLAIGIYVKFYTIHGVNEVNPATGEARVTEACEDRSGFIVLVAGLYICN